EQLADLTAGVAEQRERQPVPAGEALVRCDRIGAHPHDVGARRGERLVAVAERTRLGRTAGGVILGIEVQHDRPPPPLAEPKGAPVHGRKREIRSNIAVLDHQCAAPPPPGIPLLLCINRSSGNDSTNTAANSRNNCSNDSIIACLDTYGSRILSAWPPTNRAACRRRRSPL